MGRGLDGYFDIRALALCGFEGPGSGGSRPVSGGYGEGETPLPIPNRVVKPLSADGTWSARAWESRSPPVLFTQAGNSAIDRNEQMPGVRGAGGARAGRPGKRDRPVIGFLRANPQAFVLLVICVVLGLGTFLAVVFGLLSAGSVKTTGEPSGVIVGGHAAIVGIRSTML